MKNNTSEHPRYAGAKESAAALRKDLRLEFPEHKFSVRLGRGTVATSCYVSWTGGPSSKEVRNVTNGYVGATFNGMDDSTGYTRNIISVQGESVITGLAYITHQRDRGEDVILEIELCESGFPLKWLPQAGR